MKAFHWPLNSIQSLKISALRHGRTSTLLSNNAMVAWSTPATTTCTAQYTCASGLFCIFACLTRTMNMYGVCNLNYILTESKLNWKPLIFLIQCCNTIDFKMRAYELLNSFESTANYLNSSFGHDLQNKTSLVNSWYIYTYRHICLYFQGSWMHWRPPSANSPQRSSVSNRKQYLYLQQTSLKTHHCCARTVMLGLTWKYPLGIALLLIATYCKGKLWLFYFHNIMAALLYVTVTFSLYIWCCKNYIRCALNH